MRNLHHPKSGERIEIRWIVRHRVGQREPDELVGGSDFPENEKIDGWKCVDRGFVYVVEQIKLLLLIERLQPPRRTGGRKLALVRLPDPQVVGLRPRKLQ